MVTVKNIKFSEIHVTRNTNCATHCPLQIMMTDVCPVGKTQTKVAESLGQFSGHILHLVPGDH